MAGTLTATTIQNDTSSPPAFRNNSVEIGRLCRAWVNYNGVAQTIRGSFNVSSVTYNGTGDYTVNFTNSLPNANYAVVATCRAQNDTDNNTTPTTIGAISVSTARIHTKNAANAAVDSSAVYVSVFSS